MGEWKVTDIAVASQIVASQFVASQLGTRERLHYKKDLYGKL